MADGKGDHVAGRRKTFRLELIKPSHYDDDGYVIQWVRSAIPSNSLAALYGLAADARDRRVLGDDVDIAIAPADETNTRIRPERIARRIRRADGGLVGLVGVQSNQYPRALDLARRFRALGVPVAIGGFHVSGSLAMLPEMPPELQEALDMGVILFAGEAEEGRLDRLLQDAWEGRMQPVYNHMADLPGIEAVPPPILPATRVKRTAGAHTSFDAGRGCPFQCSFCTIINVQGRKSRHRNADDIERIVRENYAQGVDRFFITDDNFARNSNWEEVFDRLIHLREAEGLKFKFLIQVDTLCHKIPRFIEKAGRAGVNRVFIGLENINPENLLAAKKRQNKITEYRAMLQAWRAVGCLTYAGYILGFPNDTPESIARDIEIIKRELPVDLLEFFYLTPLPGSEDHANLHRQGAWMDPDLNKYDLNHVTAGHARMSAGEWDRAYRLAWRSYYTPEHVETILKRARASGMSVGNMLFLVLWFYGCIMFERVHPLEGGWLRRKARTDRRPGLPVESPVTFYPRYVGETLAKHARILALWWRLNRTRKAIKADPAAFDYRDLALTPPEADEFDSLELYSETGGGREAVARSRRQQDLTARLAS